MNYQKRNAQILQEQETARTEEDRLRATCRYFLNELGLYSTLEFGLAEPEVLDEVLKNLICAPQILMDDALQTAPETPVICDRLKTRMRQKMLPFGYSQQKIALQDFLTVGSTLFKILTQEHTFSKPHSPWTYLDHWKDNYFHLGTYRAYRFINEPFEAMMIQGLDDLNHQLLAYQRIDQPLWYVQWDSQKYSHTLCPYNLQLQRVLNPLVTFNGSQGPQEGYKLRYLHASGHLAYGAAHMGSTTPVYKKPIAEDYCWIYIEKEALRRMHAFAESFGPDSERVVHHMYRTLGTLGPNFFILHRPTTFSFGRVQLQRSGDSQRLWVSDYEPIEFSSDSQRQALLQEILWAHEAERINYTITYENHLWESVVGGDDF